MAKTSNTISDESGHPCLIPDHGGDCFHFSSTQHDTCCTSVTYSLYCVEVRVYLLFWGLSWGMWSFTKCTFCIYRCDHMIFFFILLIWFMYHLCMLNLLCIPGINFTWLWHIIIFMCCWDSIWEILHLCSSGILIVSFLVLLCPYLLLLWG